MEPDSNYLTLEELVHMFIDIVSKNGNLLLNVGPMADGTIPEIQKKLILDFGSWLETNGIGLYGTRPWVRAESKTTEGLEVRYTQKDGALYAFLLGKPSENPIMIESLNVEADTKINLVGYSEDLEWHNDGDILVVSIKDDLRDSPAYLLKISPIPIEQ